MRTLLLVEDDPDTRELLCELLADHFVVHAVADGETALEVFDRFHPDAVVTDESLPGVSGSELALRIKERAPHVRVVLASGYRREDRLGQGIDAVLEKPINLDDLVAAVTATEPQPSP